VRHFVGKDKSDRISVPIAQVYERARDENEPTREGKSGWPIGVDNGHLEAVKSIPDDRRELSANLVQ